MRGTDSIKPRQRTTPEFFKRFLGGSKKMEVSLSKNNRLESIKNAMKLVRFLMN